MSETKRKELPASAHPAAARCSNRAAADHLPSEILSHILECLGLQAAAIARAVCRRWREAAEAVLWRRLDIASQKPERVERIAGLLVGASAGAGSGRRWIRVAPGASLRLRMSVLGPRFATRERNPWPAAVVLVAACAAASGGLGGVDVRCARSSRLWLADLLAALVPPGAASCPSLRSLCLSDEPLCEDLAHAADLEPLLRPFPNLESLALPLRCCADRPAMVAIARRLPYLRRLEITLAGYEAADTLSALPRLEYLAAFDDGYNDYSRDAAPLVEGLASGAAALSLKELRWDRVELSAAGVRALPRLVSLQRLLGPFSLGADVTGDDLARLGSCPALVFLGPLLAYPAGYRGDAAGVRQLAGRLAGLGAALRRCPSLETLELSAFDPPAEELRAVAALAGGAPGRLALELEVDLAPGGPAEAAAALAGAPLGRLALSAFVGERGLREGLLGGLAAFAACPAADLEVRLETRLGDHGQEGAGLLEARLRAAVATALPAARVVLPPRWI